MQESTRMRVAAVIGSIVRKKAPVLQGHSVCGCASQPGLGKLPAVEVGSNVVMLSSTAAKVCGCASRSDSDSDASLREWADRSVRFSNSNAKGHFDFWDPDTSAHVQMMLTEDTLWGFDFHTNCHFSGTILKQTLSIYDYETGRRYDFYL